MKILVIHGPNLNFLGKREPDIYGTKTLSHINKMIEQRAKQYSFDIEIFQSNYEGEIVEKLQDNHKKKKIFL